MALKDKHIRHFAVFYTVCFLLNFVWNLYYGLLFSISEPLFFYNKADLTGNIVMLSGIQHSIINSATVRISLDLIFLLLPILLVYTVFRKSSWQMITAISASIFNMIYCYLFSIMTFVSIEVMVSWMLFPIIFVSGRTERFYYLMHSLRILFILFFFSTAIWKLRAGGIFNTEQFSAILLQQHIYIITGDQTWYSRIILYLIKNTEVSYSLFLAAFSAEFSFIIGLFTTRFDKILMILFIGFIVFNYFLMNINYFTWLPFAACLYFSDKGLKK